MKHLAQIQCEFLKFARNWDDLSYEEQKGYISRHPKTKRKITAKPESSSQLQNENTTPTSKNEDEQLPQNIGKINQSNKPKLIDLFKPLFKEHEDYLRTHITKQYNDQRKKFLTQFPNEKTNDDLKKAVMLLDYPDNQQVKDFIDRKNQMNDRIDTYRDKHFLKDFPVRDRQGYLEFYSQFGRVTYDKNQFDEYVNKIIDYAIESNESKLVNAIYSKLEGLNIKSVKEIHSHIGKQGIEGTYKVELADGTTGRMKTRSIFAGGYNIQVLHYRYLIGIDDSLKDKKVIEEDPLTRQEYEVKNIIRQSLPNDFDISNPIPKEILQNVENLPGASRNFSPLIKRGWMYRREYGNYTYKRFNYYLTQQGLDAIKQEDEEPVTVQPDDKLTKHFEKQKEKYAKSIASIFQDIKSRIKDWNTWLKGNLEYSIQQGSRSPDELTKGQLTTDRLQAFINKHPYKRPEVYQKVYNNEFKISDFDEISDLFTDSSDYARLKRAIQKNEYKGIGIGDL